MFVKGDVKVLILNQIHKYMKINKNVAWKTLSDKVVAVKTDTGVYYTMNEVSSLIWSLIDQNMSIPDICKNIQTQFDNDDLIEIEEDVKQQIEEWKNELLIV